MEKPIALLAIDIETSGGSILKNYILSIGWCLGDLNGKVIDCRRIDFQPIEGRIFDTFVYDSFWKGHSNILNEILKNPKPPLQAITEFAAVLDGFESLYDLRIITDNPAFDLYFISYYFEFFLSRLPITRKFGRNELYRPVFDTDSFHRGFIHQDYQIPFTSDGNVVQLLASLKTIISPESSSSYGNHLPENDARHIYALHTDVLRAISVNQWFLKN
jgi:hypothetical protein